MSRCLLNCQLNHFLSISGNHIALVTGVPEKNGHMTNRYKRPQGGLGTPEVNNWKEFLIKLILL